MGDPDRPRSGGLPRWRPARRPGRPSAPLPGGAAAVVVVLVVVDMLAQYPVDTSHSIFRLWAVWSSFHSGTNTDGTSTIYAGNIYFYLLYLLCLCAAAVVAAPRHDRTARTPRVRGLFAAVVVVGLLAVTAAMTTGPSEDRISPPVPARVSRNPCAAGTPGAGRLFRSWGAARSPSRAPSSGGHGRTRSPSSCPPRSPSAPPGPASCSTSTPRPSSRSPPAAPAGDVRRGSPSPSSAGRVGRRARRGPAAG